MSSIGPKLARLRLDPMSYEHLRQQILRRDGWRCQSCGTVSNLEAHHKQFRSQAGVDTEENLITLCAACHDRVHSLRAKKLSRNGETNDGSMREPQKSSWKL